MFVIILHWIRLIEANKTIKKERGMRFKKKAEPLHFPPAFAPLALLRSDIKQIKLLHQM